MANLYVLNKVRLFIQNNPDKIVVATGDVKQLQGVEILTNCQDPATYMDNCLGTIFKYNIFLTICERVGAKIVKKEKETEQKLMICMLTFGEINCQLMTSYPNILNSLMI